jgi:proline iminopeptidase
MRTTGSWPIEFEVLGNPAHPAIVLIMGLGMQLTSWPDAFCQMLVNGGYRVVRLDNRDSGLSARAPNGKYPGVMRTAAATLLGLRVRTPYALHDMAGDAVAVMDTLHIEQAHVVGASMGGMIAQVLAAHYPRRVLSLTSIMSSSGNPHLPWPSRRARQALLGRPANPEDAESVVDHLVHVFAVIGSPAYPEPKEALRQRIKAGVQRAYVPAGTARQLLAVIASGDRRKLLRSIQAPTLVIHGRDDPLVPLAAGQDTAAQVPGSSLLVIDGMGHDLPAALLPQIANAVMAHCSLAN